MLSGRLLCRRPAGPCKKGRFVRHAQRRGDIELRAHFPFDYVERIQRIAAWEDRPVPETLRTLAVLGLSVYDRLAVSMGAKIPKDCPTPSPSLRSYAGTAFGERIFNLEAIRLIERQRRLDIEFRRAREQERAQALRRAKTSPWAYAPPEDEDESEEYG